MVNAPIIYILTHMSTQPAATKSRKLQQHNDFDPQRYITYIYTYI